MRVPLAFLAAVSVPAAACVALEGFSGDDAPDAGNASDGGAPSGDGAGGQDGAAPSDGGDAATVAFCKEQFNDQVLCSDFDEGAPLDDGWPQKVVDAPNGLTLDTANAFSPPAALLVVTPSFTPQQGSYRQGYLQRTFGAIAAPHVVQVELRVRPNRLGAPPSASGNFTEVRFMNISFTPKVDAGVGAYALFLFARDGVTGLTEVTRPSSGDQYTDHTFVTNKLTVGKWSSLVLHVDFDAHQIELLADGVSPLDTSPITMHDNATTGELEAHLGAVNSYDSAGSSLLYDDVRIREH